MKEKRQAQILELINTFDIQTQDELTKLLSVAGFDATQATVSRDIKEMSITKAVTPSGTFKYVLYNPEKTSTEVELNAIIYLRSIIAVDVAENLLVTHTNDGTAMAVAFFIDYLNLPAIVGTIAGDNTIFSACKSNEDANEAMMVIRNMIKSQIQ